MTSHERRDGAAKSNSSASLSSLGANSTRRETIRPPSIRTPFAVNSSPPTPRHGPTSAKTINQAQYLSAASAVASTPPAAVNHHHHQNHGQSPHDSAGSSSSVGQQIPHTPTPATGLRAHLNQLLPKHASFRVRVTIHQISSVPLVNGEFRVRWKFRSVHTPKGIKVTTKGSKGKDRQVDLNNVSDSDDHQEDDVLTEDEADNSYDARPSMDSSIRERYANGSSSASSGHKMTPPLSSNSTMLSQPGVLKQNNSKHPPSPQGSFSHMSPPKGNTEYLKLNEHNVTWEHPLDLCVKWDVNRDTAALGGGKGSEMKLVVMQRVIAGDPDAPHQPRLGAVYINLAEYADRGPVTRRYLLSESKTNATLKLTISVDHISGETMYIAPPLPKGEILGGMEGLLDSDVYRTRPRALDLYSMYTTPATPAGKDTRRHHHHTVDLSRDLMLGKLSSSFGPKTTETLIDALFNPAPTLEGEETPFTYRTLGGPPLPTRFESSTISSEGQSQHSSASIADTTSTSSDSREPSLQQSEREQTVRPNSKWWRKLGVSASSSSQSSRPRTPQNDGLKV